jgi:glycine cleavage system H protein
MPYPEEMMYSKEHEWVKLEGANVRIGITEYAQDELGDVVYVELPEIGIEVSANTAFITVESVKAASDVYAPISGTVMEVNSALEDQPELINQAAHADGWLAVLELSDPSEMDNLLSAEEYQEFVGDLD